MSEHLTGGCQCGAIRYRLDGPLPPAYACHCGECKKQSASAFSMSIPIHYGSLVVHGQAAFFETQAFSGKTKYNFFCRSCGTRLWHSNTDPPQRITLKAGTLDDPDQIAPAGHLWVSRKQPGIELDPSSDQHQTQPDDVMAWRAGLRSSR